MTATVRAPERLGEKGAMGPRFWRWFAALLVVAAAAQLAQVQWRLDELAYDGPAYSNEANLVADGDGLIGSEALFFSGALRQSAVHPPANTLFLSLSSMLGWREPEHHQRWEVLAGVLAVALTALAAREVAGDRAGLIAAGIAALHPGVWSFPAQAMSETPMQAATGGLLLATYRWWREPTLLRAGWVGGMAALVSLARGEGALLMPILALAMLRHPVIRGRRITHVGVAAVWFAVLLGPWFAFNLSRFEKPVLVSTAFDIAMPGANCTYVYNSEFIGYWHVLCREFNEVQYHPDGTPFDESEEGELQRRTGLDYMEAHSSEVPKVMWARVSRTLSIWSPIDLARQESENENRNLWVLVAATATTYALLVPAVLGGLRLRRAGWTIAPPVALLVAAVAGAALTHGTTRYRAGLELALVLFASVAIDAWLSTRQRGAPRGRP